MFLCRYFVIIMPGLDAKIGMFYLGYVFVFVCVNAEFLGFFGFLLCVIACFYIPDVQKRYEINFLVAGYNENGQSKRS